MISKYESARILIVDDEELILDLACRLMNHLGMHAEGVKSISECVNRVQEAQHTDAPYHLILVDLNLSFGDAGDELPKRLTEMAIKVPMLLTTGLHCHPVVENCREFGFCGVVHKPYSVEEIGAAVKQALSTSI